MRTFATPHSLVFCMASVFLMPPTAGLALPSQEELVIALLQMPSVGDQKWNRETGEAFCREAKQRGADIAVFPEMVNIGYQAVDFDQPGAMEAWKGKAVGRDGAFVEHFRGLAAELEMAILITYLERTEGLPKNTATLYDRQGKHVLSYSKVHTVDPFPMETAVQPGEDFYVAPLDTRLGPVQVGVMICYDREFPESARILMLKGAEVVLTPNACGLEVLRLGQFRARAWENSMVCAMANYAEGEQDDGLNGHSCVYSAEGEELLVAGTEPGVFLQGVDLAALREYRSWTYWGNAYRRPHRYGLLTSPEVEAPFVRKNGFGEPFERLER